MELIFSITEHIPPHCPRYVVGEALCGDDAGIVLFEIDRLTTEVNCVEVGVCEHHTGRVWVGGVPQGGVSGDCIEGIVDFRN